MKNTALSITLMRSKPRNKILNFHGSFLQIEQNVQENADNVVNFRDLFQRSVLKPTSVGISLLILQQLCGVDAIAFYTVKIFQDAGSSIDPNLATIIMGTVQVIFAVIAVYLVERVGRRIMLISTHSFLGISLIVLGLSFYLLDNQPDVKDSIGWLPLTSLTLYTIAFSLGIGPIGWLMIGEILPNHVIGKFIICICPF